MKGPTALSAADALRLRRLRRMQAVAFGLLVLAAVVYLLTYGRDGGWGYVNAAAEASMVGAVADWFAVTALFRRPLGLPIPHTALIPERKRDLGTSLEQFVTDSFLTPEIARERALAAQPSLRVGGWLSTPENAARAVREAAPALRRALDQVRPEDLRTLIERELVPRLSAEPLSPTVGSLLGGIVRDGAHHRLVNLAVDEIHRWLLTHEREVADAVRGRAPWWSPRWVDDQVVGRIYLEVVGFVESVRDDPRHRARIALDTLLGELARNLQHDAATMARAEGFKERIMAQPRFAEALYTVAESVRGAVSDALADQDGALTARMRSALVDLGERLVRDDELRASVDNRIADGAGYLVRTYGAEIASTISHTVDRWDGQEAARRLELLVGRDLQYIRINGTVVGALVGLLIHAVSALL